MHAGAGAGEVADRRYDGQTDFDLGLNLVLEGLERWR